MVKSIIIDSIEAVDNIDITPLQPLTLEKLQELVDEVNNGCYNISIKEKEIQLVKVGDKMMPWLL